MPMKFYISSKFGAVEAVRGNKPHTGVDIPLEVGTKLRSFIDGTVERVINGGDIGKGVVIRDETGNHYIYGHLSRITCKVGQHVDAGREIIGLSGNTGHSTGPHLHFAIQQTDGSFIDPTPAIKALESVTGADPLNLYIGSQPMPGSVLDWLNHASDKTISGEGHILKTASHPVQSFIQHQAADFYHWIVANLPDIMGYGTILAGMLIILGSMIGKGGMIKPLAIYAGALIAALCVLAG